MYSAFWRKDSQIQDDDDSIRDAKVSELRAALGPISGRSLKYCSDACLRRYLEARNWNVDEAKKMLEETLHWRSTFKPEEIGWHEIAHVGATGIVSRADFHDQLGRSILIMRPGMQKTIAGEDNVRHLVYLLENAILSLPEGQEQMTFLVDFTGWTMNTNTPINICRDIINVLQNHYPERLALVVFFDPPRIFEAFWMVLKYFVNQKSAQKIKFVYPNNKDSQELMQSYFDEENLPIEFGGKRSLKYNHEEFSKLMTQEEAKTAKFWGSDS